MQNFRQQTGEVANHTSIHSLACSHCDHLQCWAMAMQAKLLATICSVDSQQETLGHVHMASPSEAFEVAMWSFILASLEFWEWEKTSWINCCYRQLTKISIQWVFHPLSCRSSWNNKNYFAPHRKRINSLLPSLPLPPPNIGTDCCCCKGLDIMSSFVLHIFPLKPVMMARHYSFAARRFSQQLPPIVGCSLEPICTVDARVENYDLSESSIKG